MSHVNKVQPIRVKIIRIAAIRVNFCLLLLSNGINVGIGHTCNTMRVYHNTIITCATADSFSSLFPYPPKPARPHMCLRNAYDGQWPQCDVTKSAVRLARLPRSYEKVPPETYIDIVYMPKHSLAESIFVSRVRKTAKKSSLAGLLVSRSITVYRYLFKQPLFLLNFNQI
jgi:hypothetical protein